MRPALLSVLYIGPPVRHRVDLVAGALRAGEPLSDQSRGALVDLREHLADCCELVPTTVWDRIARLVQRVLELHRPSVPDLPPPNIGGGLPGSAAGQ